MIIKIMEKLGALHLIKMVEKACQNLKLKKEIINSLNVFPVPDGDTGTNLYFTLSSPLSVLLKSPPKDLNTVLKILSRETLYGARGNSGIILASFLEGFSSVNFGHKNLKVNDVKRGFKSGSKTAYKTMLHPVEGTMLTAIRSASEAMDREDTNDVLSLFEVAYTYAEKATDDSPNLLPVLKEAGVVDAGAEGFLTILEGFLAALLKKDLPLFPERHFEVAKFDSKISKRSSLKYCLEFVLLGDVEVKKLQQELKKLGGSVGILKRGKASHVHIHTNFPDKVLSYVKDLGGIENIKKDLLPIFEEEDQQSKRKFKVLALAPGRGFVEIFKELGANAVLIFTQVKPSVMDIENAVKNLNTQKILLLPNDGDTIPVALEVADLMGEKVKVIPTSTVPEGISTLLVLDESPNEEEIREAIISTKSAKITRAIREGKGSRGLFYKKGDFVALSEKKVIASSPDLNECLTNLLEEFDAKNASLIQLFWGEPLDGLNLKNIEEKLKAELKGPDIQIYEGGQPIYHFIVGVYQ